MECSPLEHSREMKMKKILIITAVLLLVPVLVSAQGFRDLDSAVAGITRGFERGESGPIVAGVGDQVMLQFGDLMNGKSGFFGRDQASYLLDELFGKVKPSRFEVTSARKVSSQGQYHITANWTIQRGGKSETRELYVTLQSHDSEWTVASIRSSSGQ